MSKEKMICDCGKGVDVLPPIKDMVFRKVTCDCGDWLVSPNGRRMRKAKGFADKPCFNCGEEPCRCPV